MLINGDRVVDDLIKLGVDINRRNYLGYTPLEISISSNNLVMIEKLLENGASFDCNRQTFEAACMGDYAITHEMLMLLDFIDDQAVSNTEDGNLPNIDF